MYRSAVMTQTAYRLGKQMLHDDRESMRLVDRLYDWLAQGPAPACDRVFATALEHAEPAWAERIVNVLLTRAKDASWAALIGQYERLAPNIKKTIHDNDELFQGGIALALRTTATEPRTNALLALDDAPHSKLAYLIPNVLRDSQPKVRALAGQVWRKLVDRFLTDTPQPDDEDARRAYRDVRYQLSLAQGEALRTFDLHRRTEVLETAVWLARDLGDSLWNLLANRRSRAGAMLAENLPTWDNARAAYFLVTALQHKGWRDPAVTALANWRSREHLEALLREDDLLKDPAICRGLAFVQSPPWFTQCKLDLSDIDPELRPNAPRWVSQAGFRECEKTALLSGWLKSADDRVHRAAVYALAEIDSDGARALLKEVAESASPLASFARWCVLSDGTSGGPLPPMGPNDAVDQESIDEIEGDCTMLWQVCRRTNPNERAEFIAALREHAHIWHERLRSYMHSPDPRDRILVLQVISTEELALRFRHDLQEMFNDPIEGIRNLAQTLVRTVSRRPAPANPRSPIAHDAAAHGTTDTARRELRASLEQLATGNAPNDSEELVGRVRGLLREVYGGESTEVPAATTEGDEES